MKKLLSMIALALVATIAWAGEPVAPEGWAFFTDATTRNEIHTMCVDSVKAHINRYCEEDGSYWIYQPGSSYEMAVAHWNDGAQKWDVTFEGWMVEDIVNNILPNHSVYYYLATTIPQLPEGWHPLDMNTVHDDIMFFPNGDYESIVKDYNVVGARFISYYDSNNGTYTAIELQAGGSVNRLWKSLDEFKAEMEDHPTFYYGMIKQPSFYSWKPVALSSPEGIPSDFYTNIPENWALAESELHPDRHYWVASDNDVVFGMMYNVGSNGEYGEAWYTWNQMIGYGWDTIYYPAVHLSGDTIIINCADAEYMENEWVKVNGTFTYFDQDVTAVVQDSTGGLSCDVYDRPRFADMVPGTQVSLYGQIRSNKLYDAVLLNSAPGQMPEPLAVDLADLLIEGSSKVKEQYRWLYISLDECMEYQSAADHGSSEAPARKGGSITYSTLSLNGDTLSYVMGFPTESYEEGDSVHMTCVAMTRKLGTTPDWVEACGGPTPPPPATEDVFCGHNWGGMGDITFEEMKMEDDMGMFLDLYKYVGVWGDGSVWIATYSDGRDKVEYPLNTIEFLDAQLRVQATAEVGEEVTFLYEPYIKHVAVYMHNATGIDEMIADPTFRKVLMNNQVVIIRDGKFYDLMGQELR